MGSCWFLFLCIIRKLLAKYMAFWTCQKHYLENGKLPLAAMSVRIRQRETPAVV